MGGRQRHIPYHVAFIPDGNRRWAKRHNKPVIYGHQKGIDLMGEILKWCRKRKIRMVSFWAFSTENFKRDKEEVQGLMREFGSRLERVMEEADFGKYKVRARFIGDRKLFPGEVQRKMEEIERKTMRHRKYFVNLFIGYGGRPELVAAAKKLAREYSGRADKIDEAAFEGALWTHGIPDPDLIIRTSGEQRISGFLPFQSAYSELYFCKKLWPDLKERDFAAALKDYAMRKRRWGK
jgi:undecaprenyl diphosphate synthase